MAQFSNNFEVVIDKDIHFHSSSMTTFLSEKIGKLAEKYDCWEQSLVQELCRTFCFDNKNVSLSQAIRLAYTEEEAIFTTVKRFGQKRENKTFCKISSLHKLFYRLFNILNVEGIVEDSGHLTRFGTTSRKERNILVTFQVTANELVCKECKLSPSTEDEVETLIKKGIEKPNLLSPLPPSPPPPQDIFQLTQQAIIDLNRAAAEPDQPTLSTHTFTTLDHISPSKEEVDPELMHLLTASTFPPPLQMSWRIQFKI